MPCRPNGKGGDGRHTGNGRAVAVISGKTAAVSTLCTGCPCGTSLTSLAAYAWCTTAVAKIAVNTASNKLLDGLQTMGTH
ncbi:hypothetical protein PHMEG_00020199 [Phytophthora megakarya]|uniref:Uncharacterized protein n=1 Tax=Phytophthora megakarya TaxID=4795 RepID=A0A225VPE4_9STRA|nr:hypothetical protein PHMEG_00020199 [Phytophthora megakarya]